MTRAALGVTLGLTSLVFLAGCQTPESALVIRSETLADAKIEFPTCYYQAAGNGELFVVGNTIRDQDEFLTAEWIELKIYWKPRPGKTASNDSMTNALIWYAVQQGEGLTVYRGTAFVRVKADEDDGTMLVRVRRASFDEPITLGPVLIEERIRLSGTLIAEQDSMATGRLRRELDTLITPAIPLEM